MRFGPVKNWSERLVRLNQLVTSRVARNTGWMLLGEVGRVSVQAIYFVSIARQLGSASYGLFASVLALVAILGSFATWGWGNLLVKYVSRDRATFPSFWGQTLVVGLISGGSLCVVAVAVSSLIFGDTVPLSLVLLVALADLIAFRLVGLCGNVYQAHDRLGNTAGLQLLVSIARLGAAGLMSTPLRGATAIEWAVLYLASTAVAAIVSLGLVTRAFGFPHFGLRIRKKDVVEGFHFSLSLSSATMYNDVDKAMLGRFAPFAAVGIYSAAYRAIDAAFIPVRALLFATYAKFFQHGERGIEATSKLARRLLVPSVAYSLVACGALAIGAPMLEMVLGNDFAESVSVVRFLAAIPLLRAVQVFASDALTGAGYQSWRSSLQVLVAVINIGLNLWLIPSFSWRGAAITSLICDTSLALGMWILVWCAVRRSVSSRNTVLQRVGQPIRGSA